MKHLLTIFAALLLCSVWSPARNRVYVDTGGVKSELNRQIDLKASSLHLNIGGGEAGFKFGARLQHNFNRYFSWDALTYNYVVGFNDDQFNIMTGLRGFTPTFGRNKNLKFYLSMDIGYGAVKETYKQNNPYYFRDRSYDYYEDRVRTESSFAWSAEFGFHFSKHFSVFANFSFQPENKIYNSSYFGIGLEF